ncbi:MAG: HAD-IIIC family phosphatase [Synergistaceae bacterium]|nr:HAD-IIIC family phosphatase [Synergistaceae bacterium]
MIALLSNVTIESLASRLKNDVDVFIPPGFDSWRSELLNPSSALWRDEIKTIYVILHGEAFFPAGVREDFAEVLSGPLALLSRVQAERPDKLFVVSTLDIPPSPAMPLAGKNFAARAAFYWREELEKMDVPLLDLVNLAAEAGREHFYSAKMWYFGSLPFSQRGEILLTREILRFEKAARGERKKCLILDLDNTLWGGVVGEDGAEGISISSYGMGSRYRDVQRIVKELAEQGVLLAVSSKNNLEDALLPFRERPEMLLREEDFVKFKADWNPKPGNIAAIARELNIGPDSLVFIDDNPLEREAVKTALPEVAVPDFPHDTSSLPAFMAEVAKTYFTALRTGGEDREKTVMYRTESEREAVRAAHATLDDYLESLDMKLDIHRLREDEIARAAQLTQKTNQFNLTTRRYTEADIAAMMENDEYRVWIADLRDRFGGYGRICLVIARVDLSAAIIDTFLMSCRVMGRGVEDAVMSFVERSLFEEGITTIRGLYVPTAKNEPVRDFWNKMGYIEEGAPGPDETTWAAGAPFKERSTKICLNC